MRGQAPLEFIIKYGGILILLIGIFITLFSLGIVSFDQLWNDACSFPTGITCVESTISQTGLRLVLQNTFTQDITLSNIRETNQNCTGKPLQLPSGKTAILTITGCRYSSSRTPITVPLSFTIQTIHGATREVEATIRGTIR